MNLDRILGERLAIVGGTGSGKSYTARGLVERALAEPQGRVGIIDPTGVWYGLRMKPDGKGAGFPVVMFGGDHSDVPLIETAGRVIAQAVAATHQSWVIDTSALKTKAAERRFMLDFLDALFEANREDITLVVDEADRFSPQRMTPETARLHERMEEIVRRGRVRGFTPWLITQRPASLNKDVLSQATAMICMRMTGAHDRQAMADVIEGQADKATARAIIDAMPRHKVGNGLVWAPQQDILLPVAFPKITTLDTMRAPKPGEHRSDKALPPIDLGALRDKLATVETEAKANDPKELRAEIAKLKGELAKKPTAVDPAALVKAGADGWAKGQRDAHREIAPALKGMHGLAVDLAGRLEKLIEGGDAVVKTVAIVQSGTIPSNGRLASSSGPGAPSKPRFDAPTSKSAADDGRMDKGGRLILTVLAQRHPERVPVERMAAIAGYSRNGGSWRTYMSRLRTSGYIEGGPSPHAITPAGLAALGPFEPLPTGAALLDHWVGRLGKSEGLILKSVAAVGGEDAASEVADRLGFSTAGGSWRTYLSRLRTLGLITGSRAIKLHEDLR